ncbi:hypothetical protein PABG_05828 [Paracoccidioides brasiliensis Pb03]|uniref:Uncharacterized protein n=2 Tax=Paracoccidioides brasiliensis TaxID=121759 RepID=C1GFY7_PARBD|nr:uncharacterized protein PADG_06173 [Paracoccidioides brasiliensis Pb18]EEH23617.2 hypothetical protein PABG_05828 [Paracoccidioides brasiliensis Pb03]EEH50094.2 hypothetical protein PADG_06173 [Paracoccidioides brasiliensis Pb18]ODH51210.1 hypothetical protein GX48_02637 [Paracoccidioides brasiliensis]
MGPSSTVEDQSAIIDQGARKPSDTRNDEVQGTWESKAAHWTDNVCVNLGSHATTSVAGKQPPLLCLRGVGREEHIKIADEGSMDRRVEARSNSS